MPKGRNLIGQRFHKLTVIEEMPERKHGNKVWKCQCDCGNIKYAYTNLLTSGSVQSCGCGRRENLAKRISHDELIGKKFGLLTVIRKDYEHQAPNGSYKMLCQCDCGNVVFVSPIDLKTNHTQSCGCLNISIGELKIKQLLQENNISFECEKIFPTCKNPKTNYPLRFDFFVDNKYLIEYNGKQHYIAEGTWGKNLETIQERDNFKKEWCKVNNIPLIIIPYTYYNELTIDDLLLSDNNKFILT